MAPEQGTAFSTTESARRTIVRLQREAELAGLDVRLHRRVVRALAQSGGTGPNPLDQAAVIATHQEEQRVGAWTPGELREIWQAATRGEWWRGRASGPYPTSWVDDQVAKLTHTADEFLLFLPSGKVVRYSHFRELLDHGCFPIE